MTVTQLTVIAYLFWRVSPILLASGVPEGIAANAIRLSVGRGTELRDVDVVVADLKRAANEILIEVAVNDESASARQWHWRRLSLLYNIMFIRGLQYVCWLNFHSFLSPVASFQFPYWLWT